MRAGGAAAASDRFGPHAQKARLRGEPFWMAADRLWQGSMVNDGGADDFGIGALSTWRDALWQDWSFVLPIHEALRRHAIPDFRR